jgi:hypothetical protein
MILAPPCCSYSPPRPSLATLTPLPCCALLLLLPFPCQACCNESHFDPHIVKIHINRNVFQRVCLPQMPSRAFIKLTRPSLDASREPRDGPRRPKGAPREPKESPETPQESPKTPPEPPRRPKSAPRPFVFPQELIRRVFSSPCGSNPAGFACLKPVARSRSKTQGKPCRKHQEAPREPQDAPRGPMTP